MSQFVILVDTSAWVEYDRATGSATDLHLTDLIASGVDLAATEPVLMEVLAGRIQVLTFGHKHVAGHWVGHHGIPHAIAAG